MAWTSSHWLANSEALVVLHRGDAQPKSTLTSGDTLDFHYPQEGFGPKTDRGQYHWHYNRDKFKKKKDSPALFPGAYIPGGDCPEEEPVRNPDVTLSPEAKKAIEHSFYLFMIIETLKFIGTLGLGSG